MSAQSERESPATEIASFITEVTFSDLPPETIRTAKRAFIDTIGVTLAGVKAGAGLHVMDVLAQEQGKTTLIGRDKQSSLFEAVFANATAGHALDFDDTALAAMDGHPSTPLVAPLLAVGEREHSAGRDLLTAYVVGFEAQAYLNTPITPGHYEGGWHATSTLGTFGAAAATASLLDLPSSTTEEALNMAASMPAGLKRNFGTMTKPIHVGHAARSGVTAALLSMEGVDADTNAIGGERGFFDLYRGDREPDMMELPDLAEGWSLLTDGIDLKKYACCHYTHAAIYGIAILAEQHDLNPSTVDQIRVEASQGAADAVEHDDPDTSTQAKFSMPYVVAYALVNGTVDLEAFDENAIDDPTVQAIREQVVFEVDDDRSYSSNAASITVETTDGTIYEHIQERPPGSHENPLTNDELREKFMQCGTRTLSENTAQEAYRALESLSEVDDITEVTAIL